MEEQRLLANVDHPDAVFTPASNDQAGSTHARRVSREEVTDYYETFKIDEELKSKKYLTFLNRWAAWRLSDLAR